MERGKVTRDNIIRQRQNPRLIELEFQLDFRLRGNRVAIQLVGFVSPSLDGIGGGLTQ